VPNFEFTKEKMEEMLRNLVESVVKQHHMVEMGVCADFEDKLREYDPDFEISNFNADYVNNQRNDACKKDVINIFKYYAGSDLLRTIFLKPEPLVVKSLEKIKVQEETGGEENAENVEKTGETQQMVSNEVATDEQSVEQEVSFGNQLMDAFIELFISDEIFSRKFTIMKCPVDNQGDQGFVALCKMMPDLTPVPEPEEPGSKDGEDQAKEDVPVELEVDEEGNPVQPKEVEIIQEPYNPPENYRHQNFEDKILFLANRHEEMNILAYHQHMAIGMRKEIIHGINGMFGLNLEQQTIQDIVEALEEKETEVIQKYISKKTVHKTDVVFLNSY